MIKSSSIECLDNPGAQLGETPLWCSRTQKLWWIDIERPTLYSHDPATSANESFSQPGTYLGSLALTRSGQQLLARDLELYLRDEHTGETRFFAQTPDEHSPITRLNDGRVDAQGRFWIGTMDNELHRRIGGLYRVDPDGGMTRFYDDIIVSNGIAFTPDGKQMYLTDTRRHLTWRITLNDEGDAPLSREVMADYSSNGHRPDGACVDIDGCLWQAFFAGGEIVRYTPDGRIDKRIPLPVTNPTCLCFGGRDHKTLFITTARKFLAPEQLASEPLAGALLAIEGIGQGVDEHLFDC